MPGARSILGRCWWTACRFGLAPHRLRDRIHPRTEVRLLTISVPKAGTHLLERAICLEPGFYRPLVPTLHEHNLEAKGGLHRLLCSLRGGQVLVSHLYHSDEARSAIRDADVRSVFLIRDPRDIAVSSVHFIMKHRKHRWHHRIAGAGTMKERLRLFLRGDEESGPPSFGRILRAFSGWLDDADLVLRFEEFVGPDGGGSAMARQASLLALLELMGVADAAGRAEVTGPRMFSANSPTFRRGRIGRWVEHFDDDLLDLLDREAGPMLMRYGYGEGE